MDNRTWLKTLRRAQLRRLAFINRIQGYDCLLMPEMIEALVDIKGIQNQGLERYEMYTKKVLDHWDKSLQGTIEHSTHTAERRNETCHDWVKLEAIIKNGVIEDLQFQASGCCLAECCAAMTVEIFRGVTLEFVRIFENDTLFKIFEIRFPPFRRECVTMGLDCLRELVNEAS